MMLKQRKERAVEAIVALGFGSPGDSAHVIKYTNDLSSYKASKRIVEINHELDTIEFGFTGVYGGTAVGVKLFCKECDDGSAEHRWCNHLAAVVRGRYDAVALYVERPMSIAVPLIPTARSWKTVELKSRAGLDVDKDDDEDDGYNDSGYPYEAWLLHKTRNNEQARTYIGMFNQFDSLAQLRKLAFEWIEIADFSSEKLYLTCRECKKKGPSCTGTDRVLIALESVCGDCIADMAARLAQANEMKRRSQEALARFQGDSDLIPYATAEGATRQRDTSSVEAVRRWRDNQRGYRGPGPNTQGAAIQKGWRP
jgi:hypothetical protein